MTQAPLKIHEQLYVSHFSPSLDALVGKTVKVTVAQVNAGVHSLRFRVTGVAEDQSGNVTILYAGEGGQKRLLLADAHLGVTRIALEEPEFQVVYENNRAMIDYLGRDLSAWQRDQVLKSGKWYFF
ncbi:MAG: hypothetical protein H6502_04085 [Candidatus Woesearchaeota archaeon]|nr:MAG: hypothetical protein H6502_04085 [Candidatus Woesearchaeota archaeon]